MTKAEKIILVVTAIAIIGAMFLVSNLLGNYTKNGKVIAIHETSNVIDIEDTNGLIWQWEIEEGQSFELDQRVTMKMHDNGTEQTRLDDIVKEVK